MPVASRDPTMTNRWLLYYQYHLSIAPPHLHLTPPICGALDGGPVMSHVDFKKWHCRMSLSLIFPNVTCRI